MRILVTTVQKLSTDMTYVHVMTHVDRNDTTYWRVLTCTGMSLHSQKCTDMYWHVLTLTDMYWHVLTRYTLTCTNRYWHVLILSDTFWHSLILNFYNNSQQKQNLTTFLKNENYRTTFLKTENRLTTFLKNDQKYSNCELLWKMTKNQKQTSRTTYQ